MLAGACIAAAGCGTDVLELLAEEGRRGWEADRLVKAAAKAEPGLEQPLYDAERAKLDACTEINAATQARLDRTHIPFFEALGSDLVRLAILVVPVERVEDCRRAHRTYYRELDALRLHLARAGLDPGEPSQAMTPFPAPADSHRRGR